LQSQVGLCQRTAKVSVELRLSFGGRASSIRLLVTVGGMKSLGIVGYVTITRHKSLSGLKRLNTH